MTNWLYNGDDYISIQQFPQDCIGFIYKISNIETGKMYIGKKILRNLLTKKLTIKEREAWEKPGKVPTKKKEIKESNWSTYYGSSKLLLADVKALGPHKFTREIIQFCFSKKSLTYWEVYYQFKYDVLRCDSYNETILGRFFKKDAV